jgi:hypothetical protein
MRTEDLITLLSQAPRARPPLALPWALAVLLAAVVLITMLVLGLRPGLAAGTVPFAMLHKSVLLLAVLVTAGVLLLRAAQPVAKAGWGWYPAGIAGALFAISLAWEWASVPADAIFHSFSLRNFPFCLGAVSVYGGLAAAALTWLMRCHAPANGNRAALAIGFAAAAGGALGYSIHCPIDSPTFVFVAYGLPVGWVALAARLLLPRFLRW